MTDKTTMATTHTILVVDDEPSMRTYMRTVLEVLGCRVELADGGADALSRMERGLNPDLVLLDVNMPGLDGIEVLQQLRGQAPALKVVMVSCITDTKKVVRAMQLGAHDYLTKPIKQQDLETVLGGLLANEQIPDQVADGSAELVRLPNDVLFVCASPAMRKVHSQTAVVATCDIPVLLLGESGTGKEVIAALIHHLSPRAQQPFLKVNCAAVPGELLESELFGYEVGAFTGAVKAKPGKFELCNKGTILLDEIGEMSPALQAKLLHVLQDHEFSRLGARNTIRTDVRVISATNIDVQEALANKKLRSDLYYRLNGLTLRLPPLRERREEIPILLKQFMAQLSERFARPAPPITQRLIQACLSYNWPGNIRELQNFTKRYLVLGDENAAIDELNPGQHELANKVTHAEGNDLKELVRTLKGEAEAQVIQTVLEETNWNRREAARRLNISYKALAYKTRRYGIEARKSASTDDTLAEGEHA